MPRNEATILLVATVFILMIICNLASARELIVKNNLDSNSWQSLSVDRHLLSITNESYIYFKQKSTFSNNSSQIKNERISSPIIYDNNIFWTMDSERGTKTNIYSYNISTSTEARITASGSVRNPAIYSDRVVWEDYRSKDGNIYMYNLSTYKESQITTNGSAKKPAIYGDRIVWIDSRNGWNHSDIYTYNISTSEESQITDSGSVENLAIYGDRIVWEDYRNDKKYMVGTDIYTYNLSTSKESQITANGLAKNPAIYGDRIVWVENYSNIYIYDLSTFNKTQITNGSGNPPAIYKDRIVWKDNRNGKWDIHLYNISTSEETQITNNVDAWDPAIYNDRIVWKNSENESYIYMYNLSTSKEIQINYNKLYPNIIGRNGTGEIYVYTDLSCKDDSVISLNSPHFKILGPDREYVGNGSYWAKLDAPKGTYTISYEPVNGYETPMTQTKILKEGDSIEFSGDYLLKRRAGETVDFGDGYILIIKQIDPEKKEVFLELQLDDIKVDEASVREKETIELNKISFSINKSDKGCPPKMILENISRDTKGNYIDLSKGFLQYGGFFGFKPSTFLKINSIPEGAKIYVDENLMGKTGKEIPIYELKTYSVRLDLEGYESWNSQRKFDNFEQQEIEVSLTRHS